MKVRFYFLLPKLLSLLLHLCNRGRFVACRIFHIAYRGMERVRFRVQWTLPGKWRRKDWSIFWTWSVGKSSTKWTKRKWNTDRLWRRKDEGTASSRACLPSAPARKTATSSIRPIASSSNSRKTSPSSEEASWTSRKSTPATSAAWGDAATGASAPEETIPFLVVPSLPTLLATWHRRAPATIRTASSGSQEEANPCRTSLWGPSRTSSASTARTSSKG